MSVSGLYKRLERLRKALLMGKGDEPGFEIVYVPAEVPEDQEDEYIRRHFGDRPWPDNLLVTHIPEPDGPDAPWTAPAGPESPPGIKKLRRSSQDPLPARAAFGQRQPLPGLRSSFLVACSASSLANCCTARSISKDTDLPGCLALITLSTASPGVISRTNKDHEAAGIGPGVKQRPYDNGRNAAFGHGHEPALHSGYERKSSGRQHGAKCFCRDIRTYR